MKANRKAKDISWNSPNSCDYSWGKRLNQSKLIYKLLTTLTIKHHPKILRSSKVVFVNPSRGRMEEKQKEIENEKVFWRKKSRSFFVFLSFSLVRFLFREQSYKRFDGRNLSCGLHSGWPGDWKKSPNFSTSSQNIYIKPLETFRY